jgi:aspartate/methionine/tyrosine aminotransferase
MKAMLEHGDRPRSKSHLNRQAIDSILAEAGVDFTRLNIEELWMLICEIERKLGVKYLRMDFGIPGLPPPSTAIKAQIESLSCASVASRYPPYGGIDEIKHAVSRFVKKFIGIEVGPECCITTCGSTEGAFITQAIAGRRNKNKDTMLYIEPGYPPTKAQAKFLGFKTRGIELYGPRGDSLIDAIASAASQGDIAAICWSSPNNPTWNVLTEYELNGIARICERNDIIAIEDATYFGMNHRNGRLPATIARYTDNYFLLLSASKMLSYAGERVGFIITSPAILNRSYDDLEETFGAKDVRRAISKTVFNLTAGAPHSAQYAVAALLEEINKGDYDLTGTLDEYARRAKAIKQIMLRKGFHLIYESVPGASIEDGFYFTIGFPGYSGPELTREMLYYGITTLPLEAFGSSRKDGVRACVALIDADSLNSLEERLEWFREDNQPC